MSLKPYRLTVEQYDRMADAGILDDRRVELIDGFLVRRPTQSPQHAYSSGTACDELRSGLPAGWYVRVLGPVRVPEFDEPEPDLAVTRGKPEQYATHHPGPDDVALVVEVADTTLESDRSQKLRAYARGGIPEYWIINLVDRVVERYSAPVPDTAEYATRHIHRPEDTVPVIINGVDIGLIKVAEMLPCSPDEGRGGSRSLLA